jgi:hypothetical protein
MSLFLTTISMATRSQDERGDDEWVCVASAIMSGRRAAALFRFRLQLVAATLIRTGSRPAKEGFPGHEVSSRSSMTMLPLTGCRLQKVDGREHVGGEASGRLELDASKICDMVGKQATSPGRSILLVGSTTHCCSKSISARIGLDNGI